LTLRLLAFRKIFTPALYQRLNLFPLAFDVPTHLFSDMVSIILRSAFVDCEMALIQPQDRRCAARRAF
jgi:hypothetical protein